MEDRKSLPEMPSKRQSRKKQLQPQRSYPGSDENPILMPKGEKTFISSTEIRILPDPEHLLKKKRSKSLPRHHKKRHHHHHSRPSSRLTNHKHYKIQRSRSLTNRPSSRSSTLYRHGKDSDIFGRPPSRPGTRMSSKSGRTSRMSRASTKNTGVVVETMSAPNPFCPNVRGICYLMLLINLALILISIGFVIVLQLFEPAFVWNIGVLILVCGFITLIIAMIYLAVICRESHEEQSKRRSSKSEELYWTHHWQKNITLPELGKKQHSEEDRFPEDDEISTTSSRDIPRIHLESEDSSIQNKDDKIFYYSQNIEDETKDYGKGRH